MTVQVRPEYATFLKGDSSPSCAFKPLATQDQSDEEPMDKHEEGGNTLSHDSLTPQIFDTKRRTEAPKKQPTLGTSRAQTHASRYANMYKLDEIKQKKYLEIIKYSKITEQTLSENTLNELKKGFTEYLAENSSLDTASLTSLTADVSYTQEKSLEEDVKLSQYIHGTKAAVSYLLNKMPKNIPLNVLVRGYLIWGDYNSTFDLVKALKKHLLTS